MPLAPIDMLRRLGSGVRPGAGPAHGPLFADLTLQAQRAIAQGRPIRVAPSLADIAVSDRRLQQMTIAADAAESAGARTLLAMSTEGAYVIDLATRTIDRARQARSAEPAPVQPASVGSASTGSDGAMQALDAIAPRAGPTGMLIGIDAIAVLPQDESERVEHLFATTTSLLHDSGMANACHSAPASVCNASLAHLLASRMSGSAG